MDLKRCAKHAGSWYDKNPQKLTQKLTDWLNQAKPTLNPNKVKAIIGPHAGYDYCGHVSAFGYRYVAAQKASIKTVFLLGPSHKIFLKGCAISPCTTWETPLGNFQVDTNILKELTSNSTVEWLQTTKEIDENEHSMELHLPFLRLCTEQDTKIVPIMVGNLDDSQSSAFGKVLSKYFERDDTLFVISTDFCHWGQNFDYMPYDKKQGGQIWEYIQA